MNRREAQSLAELAIENVNERNSEQAGDFAKALRDFGYSDLASYVEEEIAALFD